MANSSAPFGFKQISGAGSAPTFEQVAVVITSTAGAIYYGDPVTAQADGSVAQAASTGTTPGNLGIAGIFQGCKYLSTAMKRTVYSNYFPGSGDPVSGTVEGYIINDPNAHFLVQTDSTGVALADVNGTVGFLIGSGNTATGLSGAYLDIANTLNLSSASPNFYAQNSPFRIIGLLSFPPGAPGTLANGQAYDQAIVAFNSVNSRNFVGV